MEGKMTAIDLAELVDQHLVREVPQPEAKGNEELIHAHA
jgi:hypothetical protein